MEEFTFNLATASSRTAKTWKNTTWRWSDFLARLQPDKLTRTGETAAEYRKMSKTDRDRRKDRGGFVGGYLINGQRKKGTVKYRQLLCLDADQADRDFIGRVRSVLEGYAWAVYSTHSHTPESPRYRLIIPLSDTCAPEQYEPICRKIASQLNIEVFDPTTYEAHRLMYWPTAPEDGEYIFESAEGQLLEPDQVLAEYEDWMDASSWPVARAETVAHQAALKKLGDPREKPGIVGAFCSVYTIPEAIETFLADVYTPCAAPGRYTYAAGHTSAGFIVYDNGRHAYSHHATDPISGKDVNAFDLVRLNKFGHLDEDVKEDTPVNKLPSYQEMAKFARQDDRVKDYENEAIRASFTDDNLTGDETAEAEKQEALKWLRQLEPSGRGAGFASTAKNFLLILQNDPKLKEIAGLDRFSHRIILKKEPPWRVSQVSRTGTAWKDSDDAQLRNYISTVYKGLTGKDKINDAFTEVVEKNGFHQVLDWFATLEWDGVPRLERIFIDFLGAEDSEYSRAVTRLFFRAAVARVMQPGIKFDSCLVLTGPQGIGKSTILSRMGGKWFNDSVVTLNGKDTLEQLQGSFIIELAEMQAANRSENDQLKAFISRQVDKFRAPYGRRTEEFPRQCVFASTTNEAVFLKDRTGGRRFLILPVPGGGVKPLKDFTDDYAAQCWAECLRIYEQEKHKTLELPYYLQVVARRLQEDRTEGSEKAGLIQEYLDTPVPVKSWDTMDLGARRDFIRGDNVSNYASEDWKPRDRICIMAIWCELFGNDRSTLKNIDARDLNSIMQQMPGWTSHENVSGGSLRFTLYGRQRAYIRKK